MSREEAKDRLKQLNIEDFIWIIYLIIIFLSYYSNHFERDFLINNNLISKEKYRRIIIIIFSILLVVYVYFLQDAIKSLKNIKVTDSNKKRYLVLLSFIGSFFIAASGVIFLYIAFSDQDLDIELAFN